MAVVKRDGGADVHDTTVVEGVGGKVELRVHVFFNNINSAALCTVGDIRQAQSRFSDRSLTLHMKLHFLP
jgi:hypothetical protein